MTQLIQPCCWNRCLSTSAISLAVALALPSTLLLPLSSPYTFIPVLMMSPAGLPVAMRPATPRGKPRRGVVDSARKRA
jgi:hypothetical protein